MKRIPVGRASPRRRSPASRPLPQDSGSATQGASDAAPGGVPAGPLKGFADAFSGLVERKLREMTGRKWEGVSDREKQAEASRRGAREMARRIERQTGKRPAETTIRRNARKGTTPRGVDQKTLDRQAKIDQAGGIKQFAKRAGISAGQVSRWRDKDAPIHPSSTSIQVEFDVTGDVMSISKQGRETPLQDRKVKDTVTIDEPDASSLIEAYACGDLETQQRILSDAITSQVMETWVGPADRSMNVTQIDSMTIHD